ncbi:MAG: type II toxin-antitoxin system Phd/YefM family antitoxin [Clostridiales bacterium]|nr:type II toxin-antitoxin system Phd/YefM family antitoxin [Clostridiales bacterium]
MSTINITSARQNFYQLVKDVNVSSEPVIIYNNNGNNAVLISENDWKAIQETLYLQSIPDMAESITEGLSTPISECVSENEVEW